MGCFMGVTMAVGIYLRGLYTLTAVIENYTLIRPALYPHLMKTVPLAFLRWSAYHTNFLMMEKTQEILSQMRYGTHKVIISAQ